MERRYPKRDRRPVEKFTFPDDHICEDDIDEDDNDFSNNNRETSESGSDQSEYDPKANEDYENDSFIAKDDESIECESIDDDDDDEGEDEDSYHDYEKQGFCLTDFDEYLLGQWLRTGKPFSARTEEKTKTKEELETFFISLVCYLNNLYLVAKHTRERCLQVERWNDIPDNEKPDDWVWLPTVEEMLKQRKDRIPKGHNKALKECVRIFTSLVFEPNFLDVRIFPDIERPK